MSPQEVYDYVDSIRERTQKKVEEIDRTGWQKIKEWATSNFVATGGNLKRALNNIDAQESKTAVM